MTKLAAATPDFKELLKATVLSMPAAKHLGFDFGRVAPGEVEIVQPYREELTEHNGFFQAAWSARWLTSRRLCRHHPCWRPGG
jgi:hypothetical protein